MLEKYKILDSDFLNKHYRYCKKTGKLFHKQKTSVYSNAKIGSEVGCFLSGYRFMRIFKYHYKVHIIIWKMNFNCWPSGDIDHIDGDRSNNRIDNLRISNKRLNSQNLKVHRGGHLVGTHFHKTKKVWISKITIGKKRKELGVFKTQKEAHDAYINKCKELGFL